MGFFKVIGKLVGAIFGIASHSARRREEAARRREAEERMKQIEKEREANRESSQKQEQAQARVYARRRNKYLFSPSGGVGIWEDDEKSELGV